MKWEPQGDGLGLDNGGGLEGPIGSRWEFRASSQRASEAPDKA